MTFNCLKSAMQHRNQHKQPYYEATVMIWGKETTVKLGTDKRKKKNVCVNY